MKTPGWNFIPNCTAGRAAEKSQILDRGLQERLLATAFVEPSDEFCL